MKDPLTYTESRRIVRFLMEEWKTGKYSKVSIVYNHYISAITQDPTIKTIFPINRSEIEVFLRKVVPASGSNFDTLEYTIEPSREAILESVLPLILDTMLHETLLEAKASEHAARMVAMKNAKDSANKKASSLTLVYNKTRQAAITKEVSEIVSGVESMKD
jgi:F-type H+-transporting ATPase subunit gamma